MSLRALDNDLVFCSLGSNVIASRRRSNLVFVERDCRVLVLVYFLNEWWTSTVLDFNIEINEIQASLPSLPLSCESKKQVLAMTCRY